MLAQGSRQYQSIWNAVLLTIAHFPASSNLDRALVCFLLRQCLVISFLCLLGLACLMKLHSLETPKCTPVSIWYHFGWSVEFVPKSNRTNFHMSTVTPGKPCFGKLEEHLNPWRGAMAVSQIGCACPSAHALAGKAGLSREKTPFPHPESGVQGCFADPCFSHPLALHKMSPVGRLLMQQPEGWSSEVKTTDGFSCSTRDFRKIRHLVWGLAWTLKVTVIVLEEIGLLASKAAI